MKSLWINFYMFLVDADEMPHTGMTNQGINCSSTAGNAAVKRRPEIHDEGRPAR